jgi:RHS repeat-associated protein
MFTGHERDKATGLDYMLARYYRSSIGRFLSSDLILGRRTRPKTFNKYMYARNNPITRFDPDGRKDEYLRYRATKEAIVKAYDDYHAQTGVKWETNVAAYVKPTGESILVPSPRGSTPDSVPSSGPGSERGRDEQFVGEAHVQPSHNYPGPKDDVAWLLNNYAIGINPSEDPETAVDNYVVNAETGEVRQIIYGEPQVVTTIDELRRQLADESKKKEAAPDQGGNEGKDKQLVDQYWWIDPSHPFSFDGP